LILDLQLIRYKDRLVTKTIDGKAYIHDPIRKKYIILTPEEMTRQLIVNYLIEDKKYSPQLIQLEKKIEVNKLTRRYDLIAYDRTLKPYLLLECKSHKIKIAQNTFDQIGNYNLSVKAPYLLISNGMQAYCYHVDYKTRKICPLENVPELS